MKGSHGLVCASSERSAVSPAVNEAAADRARGGCVPRGDAEAQEAPAPNPAGGGLPPSASALGLGELATGGIGRSRLAAEGGVAARVVT